MSTSGSAAPIALGSSDGNARGAGVTSSRPPTSDASDDPPVDADWIAPLISVSAQVWGGVRLVLEVE